MGVGTVAPTFGAVHRPCPIKNFFCPPPVGVQFLIVVIQLLSLVKEEPKLSLYSCLLQSRRHQPTP